MCTNRTSGAVVIVAGLWSAALTPTMGQELNCPAWEQKHPAYAPSPRWGHAMAYDGARQETVLVGEGFDGAITWTWDGHDWTAHRTFGPRTGPGAAMAYDELRQVVVLFGGAESWGETWEWDGVQWTLRSYSGPPPRAHHAMVYDSARGLTVLFGGSVGDFFTATPGSGTGLVGDFEATREHYRNRTLPWPTTPGGM